MLIGNYSVLNKTPGRSIGGSTTAFATGIGPVSGNLPSSWVLPGNWIKFPLADRGAKSSTINKSASVPFGYYPPVNWFLALSGGGLNSFQKAGTSVSVSTANLASGQYIAATISCSFPLTIGTLSGLGNFTSTLTMSGGISASLTGAGNITAPSLSSSFDITNAVMAPAAGLSAALTMGIDVTTATAVGALYATAPISCSFSLDAAGSMAGNLTSDLTMSATLSASTVGAWFMTASLTQFASLTSTLNADAWLSANVTSISTLSTATLIANGSLSANIKSYTDLTSQGLADAVWQALIANYQSIPGTTGQQLAAAGASGNPWESIIEGTYSAQDFMRLMGAALLGKVSGAAGTSITFRDTADSTDRIVATVDTAGDRITVTLNPL